GLLPVLEAPRDAGARDPLAGRAARVVAVPDVSPGDRGALRADRAAARADVLRVALPALLRGARVRHSHPVHADPRVSAGALPARGAAGHRRAPRHHATRVDLLLP